MKIKMRDKIKKSRLDRVLENDPVLKISKQLNRLPQINPSFLEGIEQANKLNNIFPISLQKELNLLQKTIKIPSALVIHKNLTQNLRHYNEITNITSKTLVQFIESPSQRAYQNAKNNLKQWHKSMIEAKDNIHYQLKEEELAEAKENIKEQQNEITSKNSRIIYLEDKLVKMKKAENIFHKIFTEIPQPRTPKKIKKLSLNPKVDNPQIFQELSKSTSYMFTSTPDHWKNLLSEDIKIMSSPIELKRGTTLSGLRYFLDLLLETEIIGKRKFNTILYKAKVFCCENIIVKATQFSIKNEQMVKFKTTNEATKIRKTFEDMNLLD